MKQLVVVGALALATSAARADEVAVPETMTIDLSSGGKSVLQAKKPSWDGMTMQVPTVAKVVNGPDGFGVTDNKQFQMTLSNKAANVAVKRRLVKADKLRKLVRFTVDAADAIVWTTKAAKGSTIEWHFVGNVRTGGGIFSCTDTAGPDLYTEADVNAMWAACKSLARAKK